MLQTLTHHCLNPLRWGMREYNMNNKIIAIAVVIVVVIAGAGAYALFSGGDDGHENPNIVYGHYPTNLMVLGNANLDNYLDDRDAEYIENLLGTEFNYGNEYFCDANYDGVIDETDVDYVRQMIAGDWDYIRYCHYLNANFEIVTFDMSVNDRHLITLICPPLDNVLLLNPDLLVGTDMCPIQGKYLPQYGGVLNNIEDRNDIQLVNVGVASDPNLELISQASADNGGRMILVCGDDSFGPGMEEVLAGSGVQVVRIPTWEYGGTLPGLLTLAYLLDVDDSDGYDEMNIALEFTEWYTDTEEYVQEAVARVPQDERPGVACVYTYTDPIQILGTYTGEYNNSLKLGIKDVTGAYMGGQATGGHGNQIDIEVISELVVNYGLDVLVGMVGSPFQIEDNQYGNGGGPSEDQGSYVNIKASYDKWMATIGAALEGEDGADFIITGYSFFSGISEPLGELILGYYLYGEDASFTLDYLEQKVNEYCQWIGIYDIDGDGVSTLLDGDGRHYEWSFDNMNLLYVGEDDPKNIMNRG